jgi:predicted metal-binding membrane protein
VPCQFNPDMFNYKEYARLRSIALTVSVLAWLLLLVGPDTCCHCAARGDGAVANALRTANLAMLAKNWMLMLVAMMVPMLVGSIYYIYSTSFTRLRNRLIALCVIGYLAVWMGAGAPLTAAAITAKALAPDSWWLAIIVGGIAVVWQATPIKQTCLNRCHRQGPIAAFGPVAHWDAFCLGVERGVWCVGSCWALMLLPMVFPSAHNLGMMAITMIMFLERTEAGAPPAWRFRGFSLAPHYLKCLLRYAILRSQSPANLLAPSNVPAIRH